MYERTYHKKVLTQKAPPEKKRRRRFPLRRVLWGTVTVLIVAAIVVVIRLPQLQVKTVDVVGTNVVDPEDVSAFIKSTIEGKYLYVFPKTSMLLVPATSIATWTKRQFPRFATVEVRRKGISGLIVTVTEHQGKYLWCDTDTTCYFMNADGLVFAPAPVFSGDAYPKIVIGQKQDIPFSPLTSAQLALVQTLLDRLPALAINPVSFSEPSEHELVVTFMHNGDSAQLLLDPNTDMEQTLQNLASALNTDPLKSSFASSAKVLEYLDARFANKIVYKFN